MPGLRLRLRHRPLQPLHSLQPLPPALPQPLPRVPLPRLPRLPPRLLQLPTLQRRPAPLKGLRPLLSGSLGPLQPLRRRLQPRRLRLALRVLAVVEGGPGSLGGGASARDVAAL